MILNYFRVLKPNVALNFMKKALENEVMSGQPKSHIASTKLNICAILSQLEKHHQGIEFANSAIQDLLTTLRIVRIKNIRDLNEQQVALVTQSLEMKDLDIPESNESAINQTLGIAYYNLAVQYEHTHDYQTAKQIYQKGLTFARISINTEQLQAQITESLIEVEKKLQSKNTFLGGR